MITADYRHMSREDVRKRYNCKKAELGSVWEAYLKAVQEAKEAEDIKFAWRERLFHRLQVPRRREAETTATFAPQPKVVDISAAFDKNLRAAQALKTINQSMAMRVKQRLESSGRWLPLLDKPDDAAIQKFVEINVRKLAQIAAEKTNYKLAEEFQYAGEHFQIPSKYLQGEVRK